MARALFPPWSDTAFRVAIAVLLLGGAGVIAAPMVYARAPWSRNQSEPIVQPVEFDHRHHVQDDGIDCLYCHDTATRTATAGIPSTAKCMGCHSQIWNESPKLEIVRESYFEGIPIRWRRVHNLPDFVYFNHAIHVSKGVGCEACHGRVDQMAAVRQVVTLTMGWCLDCHRAQEGGRERLTHCTVCHR